MKDIITKNHPMSPNGQDLISKNNSNSLSLEEIIETRVSRRSVIKGGLAVVAGSFLGMNLTGCGSSNNSTISTAASGIVTTSFIFLLTGLNPNNTSDAAVDMVE